MAQRIRSLKRQLNEAEEEASRKEAQFRHTQRELAEERETSGRLQRQLLDQHLQTKYVHTHTHNGRSDVNQSSFLLMFVYLVLVMLYLVTRYGCNDYQLLNRYSPLHKGMCRVVFLCYTYICHSSIIETPLLSLPTYRRKETLTIRQTLDNLRLDLSVDEEDDDQPQQEETITKV